MPRRSASRPGSSFPDTRSSSAIERPTLFESRAVTPWLGIQPIRASGCEKIAVSSAIRMSQASASSAPAPRATPVTAATVGFVRCSKAQKASCPRVTCSCASFGAGFAHSSMSIPTMMRGAAIVERPWFARWPADVPRSLDYPDIAVQELLRRTAREHGDRPALTFYGKTLTYRDLDAIVDRFAAGLRTIGVKAGDRVSLLLPNTPHFVVAFFAALRAGAIVVQTNPILTPRELEALWNDAGVETVVALDLFWHNVVKTKPRTGIKRVVVCDAAEFLKTPLRHLYPIKRRKDLKKAGHWPRTSPRAAC